MGYLDSLENHYVVTTAVVRVWVRVNAPDQGQFWGDYSLNETLPDPVTGLADLKAKVESLLLSRGYIKLTIWADTSDTESQNIWVQPATP